MKYLSIFISVIILLSIYLTITKPKIHKEFKFNIIEKIIKFNTDGSTSIIEKTTKIERKTK